MRGRWPQGGCARSCACSAGQACLRRDGFLALVVKHAGQRLHPLRVRLGQALRMVCRVFHGPLAATSLPDVVAADEEGQDLHTVALEPRQAGGGASVQPSTELHLALHQLRAAGAWAGGEAGWGAGRTDGMRNNPP